MPSPTPSPWIAAFLSLLLPGAGQLYAGDRPKGWAVLVTGLGIAGGIGISLWGPAPFRSPLTSGLLGLLYPFLWLPAVVDAFRGARGRPTALLAGASVAYVVLMLVGAGPFALPLLWQSPRFSHRAKVAWTVLVVGVALLGVALTLLLGAWLEGQM